PGTPESRHHLQTVSAGPGRYRTEPGLYICRRAQSARWQRRSRLHDPSRSRSEFPASLFSFRKDTFRQCETALRSIRRNWDYRETSLPTTDRCRRTEYNCAAARAIGPPDKLRSAPEYPWDASATVDCRP